MAHRFATDGSRDKPTSDLNPTANRHGDIPSAIPHVRRLRAAIMAIVTATLACIALVAGMVSAEPPSPEGFSMSAEGLSQAMEDAWSATVGIEARGVVMKPGEKPRRRKRLGSGIVMHVDDRIRLAIIVTNAHIITCREKACTLRVAFGNSFSPNSLVWTDAIRIVSRDATKDLAFLEVEIPDNVRPRAASFSSAECGMVHADAVISIGWPDLRIRGDWGVAPPPNFGDQTKRYSDGSFLFSLRDFRMRREDNRPMEEMGVVFHNSDVLPGSSGGPVVNRKGHVLGLNTVVLRNGRRTDQHRFCARREVDQVGQCMHAAIASIELIAAFERLYPSRIPLSGCSSPFEFELREAELIQLTQQGRS